MEILGRTAPDTSGLSNLNGEVRPGLGSSEWCISALEENDGGSTSDGNKLKEKTYLYDAEGNDRRHGLATSLQAGLPKNNLFTKHSNYMV